ncbi:hypothetical protein DR75_127 [Enterococcus faecalis ATCC 29212]|nr:hypothetical protein DR75_127 [Enterococcus faecalis ATCC 29212]
MTTMLAIIGTVAIITVQVIEYNMTEIHIPTAGTFNDDDAEPPHSSVTLVFIRTILITLSLNFPSHFLRWFFYVFEKIINKKDC